MSHYIGNSPESIIQGLIKQYFYGMRRNEDGELFLIRIDQLQGQENVAVINDIGVSANNFLDFEEGSTTTTPQFQLYCWCTLSLEWLFFELITNKRSI